MEFLKRVSGAVCVVVSGQEVPREAERGVGKRLVFIEIDVPWIV